MRAGYVGGLGSTTCTPMVPIAPCEPGEAIYVFENFPNGICLAPQDVANPPANFGRFVAGPLAQRPQPRMPLECPWPMIPVTTSNNPATCLSSDWDFSNPLNAFAGSCVCSPHGCSEFSPAGQNPLALITKMYGPLTPGTPGSGPGTLPAKAGAAGSPVDEHAQGPTGPGPSTGFQPLQTFADFLQKPMFDNVPMWGALVAALAGGSLLWSGLK